MVVKEVNLMRLERSEFDASYGIMVVTSFPFIVGLLAWCMVLLWIHLGLGVSTIS